MIFSKFQLNETIKNIVDHYPEILVFFEQFWNRVSKFKNQVIFQFIVLIHTYEVEIANTFQLHLNCFNNQLKIPELFIVFNIKGLEHIHSFLIYKVKQLNVNKVWSLNIF